MSDDPTAPGTPAASVDLAEALTLGADGPPPKVAVGDRFGRFAVRGVLGIGGMGVVLEGYDPTLDRPVAIKVMASAPDSASASAGETRMVREAKAMAKLTHANVVRVYEVGSNRAGLYMVMELVDGQTLAGWLRAEDALAHIPIVAFTAWPEETARKMAESYGCDGFIGKPVLKVNIFLSQIASYLK